MKIIAYLRPEDVEQLDALGQRIERSRSWLVDVAVRRLITSQIAQVSDIGS